MFRSLVNWFKGVFTSIRRGLSRKWSVVGEDVLALSHNFNPLINLASKDVSVWRQEAAYPQILKITAQAQYFKQKRDELVKALSEWGKLNWFVHYFFANKASKTRYRQAEKKVAAVCLQFTDARRKAEASLRPYLEVAPEYYTVFYPKGSPLQRYHDANNRLNDFWELEGLERLVRSDEHSKALADLNSAVRDPYSNYYAKEHLLVKALAYSEHPKTFADVAKVQGVEGIFRNLIRDKFVGAHYPYASYLIKQGRRDDALIQLNRAVGSGSIAAMRKLGDILYHYLRDTIRHTQDGTYPHYFEDARFHQAVAFYTAVAAYQHADKGALKNIEYYKDLVRRFSDSSKAEFKAAQKTPLYQQALFIDTFLDIAQASMSGLSHPFEFDFSELMTKTLTKLKLPLDKTDYLKINSKEPVTLEKVSAMLYHAVINSKQTSIKTVSEKDKASESTIKVSRKPTESKSAKGQATHLTEATSRKSQTKTSKGASKKHRKSLLFFANKNGHKPKVQAPETLSAHSRS